MAKTTFRYTTAYQFYQWGEKTSKVRTDMLNTFQKVLIERIPEDLTVSVKSLEYRNDDRISVELEGKNKDDLQFVVSILKEITGQVYDSNNVPKNRKLFGTLRSVGKIGFGLFVDVGIENPVKEVLIPLHRLRNQLVAGQKISSREICTKYGFMDYLPVEIEITKMEFEKGGKPKFEGKFSDDFLDSLEDWINGGVDIIFTTGIPRQMVKRTIAKRGHSVDVVQVHRMGPLETAIFCKSDTNAPGIISHIGPFLSNCRFSMIRPAQIKRYWKREEEETK